MVFDPSKRCRKKGVNYETAAGIGLEQLAITLCIPQGSNIQRRWKTFQHTPWISDPLSFEDISNILYNEEIISFSDNPKEVTERFVKKGYRVTYEWLGDRKTRSIRFREVEVESDAGPETKYVATYNEKVVCLHLEEMEQKDVERIVSSYEERVRRGRDIHIRH